MSKLKLFFILVILVISIFIAYVFYFFEGFDLSEVKKTDWEDDWVKNIKNSNKSVINRLNIENSNEYIINDFTNSTIETKKIYKIIDTTKNYTLNDTTSFIFYWNFKYNHLWKIEYRNEKYINNISKLFKIKVHKFKNKLKVVKSLELSPIMIKHIPIFELKLKDSNLENFNFKTEYKNEFDLFMWLELQEKLITLISRNKDIKVIKIFNIEGKNLIKLNYDKKNEGYTLEWPQPHSGASVSLAAKR